MFEAHWVLFELLATGKGPESRALTVRTMIQSSPGEQQLLRLHEQAGLEALRVDPARENPVVESPYMGQPQDRTARELRFSNM